MVYNYLTNQFEEIPERVLIDETYISSGKYYRNASGLSFGEEEVDGKVVPWWSLCPSAGKFEYDFNPIEGYLKVMSGLTIEVTIDTERMFYRYGEYGFRKEEDLLTWTYLHNAHDFSEKDMVYRFGKRKYGNNLIRLS